VGEHGFTQSGVERFPLGSVRQRAVPTHREEAERDDTVRGAVDRRSIVDHAFLLEADRDEAVRLAQLVEPK
jgi:hypothetical protein